jgi:hypothetical protein
MRLILTSILLAGCPGGPATEDLCNGEGDPDVRLGTGVGGVFEDIVSDAVLTLGAAAQGGNGVRVNVRTAGLDTRDPMDIEVSGWLDGVESATFVFEDTQLFCQPDGEGMVEGLTVGFEQGLAFGDLDGRAAQLIVTATDSGGKNAEASVDVELAAP